MLSFQLSAYRIIAILTNALPFVLMSIGFYYIISGYLLTVDCPICGTMTLLLGVAPSLAGGYHIYCMESRFYVSETEVRSQNIFCIGLYAASTLMVAVIVNYLGWCHIDAGGFVATIFSIFSDLV